MDRQSDTYQLKLPDFIILKKFHALSAELLITKTRIRVTFSTTKCRNKALFEFFNTYVNFFTLSLFLDTSNTAKVLFAD